MTSTLPSWIWDGSKFVPATGLPLGDRGVRYGMALFESVAVRNGRPEFLTEHLLRLESSCKQLDWAVDPKAYNAVRKVLENNADPHVGECRMRPA